MDESTEKIYAALIIMAFVVVATVFVFSIVHTVITARHKCQNAGGEMIHNHCVDKRVIIDFN